MQIDVSKVQSDLDEIRQQKAKLTRQIEGLVETEGQLVRFLDMAKRYTVPKTPLISDRRPKAVAESKGARFQPNRFPPAPIPEGYVSPSRRTELARKIIEAFEPNTIITASSVVDKVGALWEVPKGAKTPKHHLASIMIHETGPGAILDRVEPGHYRVKANALDIVQSRVAAEIAQAQDDAARRAAH